VLARLKGYPPWREFSIRGHRMIISADHASSFL
jgi:hypothetical protein